MHWRQPLRAGESPALSSVCRSAAPSALRARPMAQPRRSVARARRGKRASARKRSRTTPPVTARASASMGPAISRRTAYPPSLSPAPTTKPAAAASATGSSPIASVGKARRGHPASVTMTALPTSAPASAASSDLRNPRGERDGRLAAASDRHHVRWILSCGSNSARTQHVLPNIWKDLLNGQRAV
jgi:hypothetical protein